MSADFVIGIDLGTTNSVLSYSALNAEKPTIELLPIPQLVAPQTVELHTTLPSFLYLPTDQETGGVYDLPWQANPKTVAGRLARQQSADVPDRTVGAAKSWLCHSKVDRHAAILPWNAPDDVPKVSPVEASQRYLEHLVAAWTDAFPNAPIADQNVVLTVPASFDASARELTREAALAAGLPDDLVLLEEPQAAVYAWLQEVGDEWRKILTVKDTLLVCDVGGGTTDLSLVTVVDEDGDFVLRRLAVGDHLLVGGDNMDLTLAHYVAGLFEEKGISLDPWQSVSLWHSCRAAKEALLAPDGPETHTVSVLGRGSRLIGGTVSVEVERKAAQQILAEGFFPECALNDRPQRQRASGFQDIGLPFESDPAVTRHLAAFLAAHGGDEAIRPSHVLFNGGVFKGENLTTRLMSVLGDWFDQGGEKPQILEGAHDLDHAVARGAAFYGWSKKTGGLRIRGGTARAYYVGIETAGLAIPGAPRPLRALCVVPFGMEEGTAADVPSGEIGLVVGEAAQFRFFKSSVRKEDQPGDTLPNAPTHELEETDPLETVLPPDEDSEDPFVPVKFHSKVNELGLLELWCVSTQSDKRWKLEFSVREED
ncbi:Hsp70 family protein [Thalassoroseus pseudoceratinae]|uniref:Hsp70 family protein n=1 Tax=Thalassoroseus pseudoceratinae TaxID=2713176 RepID=UPI0014217B50|nr:Hsp70 family protein [Thalassoroseus pseudoceratinae]